MKIDVDIKENRILSIDPKLLDILLVDRTRTSDNEVVNILWATDNYIHFGENYTEDSQITVESITGENGLVLRPRVNKSKAEQIYRSRDKAEVFTLHGSVIVRIILLIKSGLVEILHSIQRLKMDGLLKPRRLHFQMGQKKHTAETVC